MVQFTHLPNGNLQFTSRLGDEILRELCRQCKQGMVYAPQSFTPRNIYNENMKIQVISASSAPTLVNPNVDIYEVSPIKRKIIARSAESFFAAFQQQVAGGYEYVEGTAQLVFGAYSAVMQVASTSTQEVHVDSDVPTFQVDVALTLPTKEALIEYCERFGIKIDARKSLPKIQNWLKAQSFEGK